ncbi:hypothetical protein GS534_24125 [Rhodococcus hoagii]|nr:hypothetical protein [Prescottella equi]MBM4613725.1 hypothetical protein [Prescottella equi]MBM4613732.1 hypothetical protein [Prescottella equi]MBM4618002.1 hypothetical protein [Prescottella equi]NKS33117.1 hypothetical protein [Prescottella equi]
MATEQHDQTAPAKPVAETPDTVAGIVVTEHDKAVVDHSREVLKKEAEKSDITNGPADNLTGDASQSPVDHITSPDLYKKAFPPGPDDPTKA